MRWCDFGMSRFVFIFKLNLRKTNSSASFLHSDELSSVAFSPDANSFLVGGKSERRYWDGVLSILNHSHVASKQGNAFETQDCCNCVAYSANGTIMLTNAGNSLQLTLNAGSKAVMLSLFAQYHENIRSVFSADAWRQLMDLVAWSRKSSLPGADLSALVNEKGNNFLHSSVLRGDVITVRKCLELPSSILGLNSINFAGQTAIRLAVDATETNYSILAALLDAGADVNVQDKEGNTCLHTAVKRDSLELVSCLLLVGANPALKNKWGVSPSGYSKSFQMLKLLLQKKDKDSENKLQAEINLLKRELAALKKDRPASNSRQSTSTAFFVDSIKELKMDNLDEIKE